MKPHLLFEYVIVVLKFNFEEKKTYYRIDQGGNIAWVFSINCTSLFFLHFTFIWEAFIYQLLKHLQISNGMSLMVRSAFSKKKQFVILTLTVIYDLSNSLI